MQIRASWRRAGMREVFSSRRGTKKLGFRGYGQRALVGFCIAWGALALGLGVPRVARAEGRVITISEVTIVGRVQKPIAAVDVSRIQPHLTLAELRQSFIEDIEKALYRDPF